MIYKIVDFDCMKMFSDNKNYSTVQVGIVQITSISNDNISHSELPIKSISSIRYIRLP